MTQTDKSRIIQALIDSREESDIEISNMRQRHTFEMAWLTKKQEERRNNLRSPIENIEIPSNLFAKVEIKRLDGIRTQILVDGQWVKNITKVDIEMLPASSVKVTYTQAKFDGRNYQLETVDGERQVALQKVEILANILIVNM